MKMHLFACSCGVITPRLKANTTPHLKVDKYIFFCHRLTAVLSLETKGGLHRGFARFALSCSISDPFNLLRVWILF